MRIYTYVCGYIHIHIIHVHTYILIYIYIMYILRAYTYTHTPMQERGVKLETRVRELEQQHLAAVQREIDARNNVSDTAKEQLTALLNALEDTRAKVSLPHTLLPFARSLACPPVCSCPLYRSLAPPIIYFYPSYTLQRVREREGSLFDRGRVKGLSLARSLGWLRLVDSCKLHVSFAEYCLVYRVLLQKRPIISRSLLIVATP